MKKWDVTIGIIIEAESRPEVWKITQQFLDQSKKLDPAQILTVGLDPVLNPQNWIAVNQ